MRDLIEKMDSELASHSPHNAQAQIGRREGDSSLPSATLSSAHVSNIAGTYHDRLRSNIALFAQPGLRCRRSHLFTARSLVIRETLLQLLEVLQK